MDAMKRRTFLFLLESDLLDAEVQALIDEEQAAARKASCILIPLKGKYRRPR